MGTLSALKLRIHSPAISENELTTIQMFSVIFCKNVLARLFFFKKKVEVF